MKLLRIDAAKLVKASMVKNHRLCILCEVGDDMRLLNGPWYGHEAEGKFTYPFMLRKIDEILWGYDFRSEQTDLNLKAMQIGERITLFGSPTRRNIKWPVRVFQIIEIGEPVLRQGVG